jgi:hypothetical protein
MVKNDEVVFLTVDAQKKRGAIIDSVDILKTLRGKMGCQIGRHGRSIQADENPRAVKENQARTSCRWRSLLRRMVLSFGRGLSFLVSVGQL